MFNGQQFGFMVLFVYGIVILIVLFLAYFISKSASPKVNVVAKVPLAIIEAAIVVYMLIAGLALGSTIESKFSPLVVYQNPILANATAITSGIFLFNAYLLYRYHRRNDKKAYAAFYVLSATAVALIVYVSH